MITFKITLISKGLELVLKLTLPVLVIQSKPNDDVQRSMFRANWPFVGKLMVSVLKAAFHFRVFHTHVYARKTLNLSALYIF